MSNTLPKEAKERKTYPLWSGLFLYFPDALAEVAHLSYVGNQQHNPGQPLHWAREKSTDQEDTLLRHLLDSAKDPIDTDGVRHSVKAAWRALAKAQLEIEAARKEKDPDDIQKSPPQAPDFVQFVPGSVMLVPEGSDPHEFAHSQRLLVASINDRLKAGAFVSLIPSEDGSTIVDISSVADPLGQSILVRGKLQRASDSKRGALQPGPNDSRFKDITFWNIGKGDKSNNK